MSSNKKTFPCSDNTRPKYTTRASSTESKLERKRQADREAQRLIRMRTKNYIAHLEDLVKTLKETNDPSGRIKELVTRVNSSKRERDRLLEALVGIDKIIHSISPNVFLHSDGPEIDEFKQAATFSSWEAGERQESHDSRDHFTRRSADHSCNVYSIGMSLGGKSSPDLPNPPLTVSHQSHLHYQPIQPFLGTSEQQNWAVTDSPYHYFSTITLPDSKVACLEGNIHCSTDPIRNIASSILRNENLEGRHWYMAGIVLTHILNTRFESQVSSGFDDDIAIRAVVEGWPSVANKYHLDLGWQWQRLLDEAAYFTMGIPERLAILRIMRLQFLYQLQPAGVDSFRRPEFMAASSAQQHILHNKLVEHFVWPGVRERILFSPHKFANNKFMEVFRQNYKFIWAYDPKDTYIKSRDTGLYSYTYAFTQRQSDLKSWAMRESFFEVFPELRHDIPSFNQSPLSTLSEQRLWGLQTIDDMAIAERNSQEFRKDISSCFPRASRKDSTSTAAPSRANCPPEFSQWITEIEQVASPFP